MRQAVTVADDTAAYTGGVFLLKTTGGTSPTVLLQLVFVGGSGAASQLRVDTDAGTVLAGSGNVVSYSANWWRVDTSVANDASGNTSLRFEAYPAINAHGLGGSNVATTGSCTAWGPARARQLGQRLRGRHAAALATGCSWAAAWARHPARQVVAAAARPPTAP